MGGRAWTAFGALAIWIAHLGLVPVAETDLFFRLAAGREVLRRSAPLSHNLFSFTFPQHPYLDSAWLFDVGVAALYQAGGFAALVLAKTAVLLGAYLGAWALSVKRGADAQIAALVVGLAAWVGAERMVERPHLFSLAFLIATLALLQAAHAHRRWWWGLPGLVAFWANLHAGAFVGPLCLAAWTLGHAHDRRRNLHVGGPAAGEIALVGLATAAALFATPVGFGLIRYLAFHLDINRLHPIDEFRAPDLSNDLPLFVFAAAALLVALAAHRSRPTRSAEIAPALLLAALALHSVRFAADFTLVTAPLLAVNISVLSARLVAPVKHHLGAALLLASATIVLIERTSARRFFDLELAEDVVPLPAIEFVETAGLAGRMYNDMEIGGYLAWRWFPRHRIFVDPRLPAYPHKLHALLGRADLERDAWQRAMDDFGIESALLTHAGINPRVAWWDPTRWALVYRARDARVFVRRLPRFEHLINQHEIPATFSFSQSEGTATHVLAAPPAGSPVPRCEWDLRVGDLHFELDASRAATEAAYTQALAAPAGCLAPGRLASAAAWLGALALGRGQPAAALAFFERARAAGSDDDGLTTNRALAFEALGQRTAAKATWLALARQTRDERLAHKARARAEALGGP